MRDREKERASFSVAASSISSCTNDWAAPKQETLSLSCASERAREEEVNQAVSERGSEGEADERRRKQRKKCAPTKKLKKKKSVVYAGSEKSAREFSFSMHFRH